MIEWDDRTDPAMDDVRLAVRPGHVRRPPVHGRSKRASRFVDARALGERVSGRLLRFRLRQATRLTLVLARDAVLVMIAALAAARIAGARGLTADDLLPTSFLTVSVTLLALGALGMYRRKAGTPGTVHWSDVATVAFACALSAVVVSSVWAPNGFEPLMVATFVALTTLALVGVRRIPARWQLLADRDSHTLAGALLIGRDRDLNAALAAFGEADGHRVLDRLPSAHRSRSPRPLLAQLRRRIERGDIGEVVVVSVVRSLTLRGIASVCAKAGVRCIAAFDARDVRSELALPLTVGGYPAIELVPAPWRMPAMPVKRALDLALCVLMMPLSLPILLLTAVAIRIDSRGPVFFRQRRVGLGGSEFTIWKFRSMAVNPALGPEDLAHANHYGDAPLFKVRDDPRTTRVGRFLRRTSLDELPQLLNVLRGEMSLVGPRPPLPEEVAKYAPHHYVRLSVIPGMTGPWQVGGRNLITDFEEIVRLESAYIREWSLGLDLRIMVRTVRVVVTGAGAY
jgi:exopolysaccharide biosynthesis polyprenyl glycosylphosphotransferase